MPDTVNSIDDYFEKLPCVVDMVHINNLLVAYQSKYPYARDFHLTVDNNGNKQIFNSIDIEQVPECNQGLCKQAQS